MLRNMCRDGFTGSASKGNIWIAEIAEMGEIVEMVEIVCQFARSFGAPYTQIFELTELPYI